jgi:GRAS domain family
MAQLTTSSIQKDSLLPTQIKIAHPFQEIVRDIAQQNVTSQTTMQMEQAYDSVRLYPHHINHIVSKALQWQLGYSAAETVDENLYLANSDIAQIDLFKLLIEELPHVAFAQNVVNDIIIDVCSAHQHIVLIDIGIGTAHQCSTIIRQLAQKSSLIQGITIIGIEPSVESLVAANERLQEVQKETGISLKFHPISDCIENISASTWASLAQQYRHQNIVINASFALHHIKNNEQHPNIREDIFQFLYNFDPIALLLSEPNSDHLNPDFGQRFENCLYHFDLVFKLIDELIISGDEKRALKLFFGREIKDIIGKQEEFRSERHELATTWVNRLQNANFQLQADYSAYLPPTADFISIRSTPEQFLSFEYQQESLVAVMYAVPARV